MSDLDLFERYRKEVEQRLEQLRKPPARITYEFLGDERGKFSEAVTMGVPAPRGLTAHASVTAVDATGGTSAKLGKLQEAENQQIFTITLDRKGGSPEQVQVTDLEYFALLATPFFGSRPEVSLTETEGLACDHCGDQIDLQGNLPVPIGEQSFFGRPAYDLVFANCGSGHPQAVVDFAGKPLAVALASSTSGAPVEFGENALDAAKNGWIYAKDPTTDQMFLLPIEFLQYGIPPYERPDLTRISTSPYKARFGVSGMWLDITPQAHTDTSTVIIGPDPEALTHDEIAKLAKRLEKNETELTKLVVKQYAALAAAAIVLEERMHELDKEKGPSGLRARKVSGTTNPSTYRKTSEPGALSGENPLDLQLILLDPLINPENFRETLRLQGAGRKVKGLRLYSVADEARNKQLAGIAREEGYVVPLENFGADFITQIYGSSIFSGASRETVASAINSIERSSTGDPQRLPGNLRVLGYDGRSSEPCLRTENGKTTKRDFMAYPQFVIGYLEVDGCKIPVYDEHFSKSRWKFQIGDLGIGDAIAPRSQGQHREYRVLDLTGAVR